MLIFSKQSLSYNILVKTISHTKSGYSFWSISYSRTENMSFSGTAIKQRLESVSNSLSGSKYQSLSRY